MMVSRRTCIQAIKWTSSALKQHKSTSVPAYLGNFQPCNIFHNKNFSNSGTRKKSRVCEYIYNKIVATGPISVAELMRLALTSHNEGYYMSRDMIGAGGDFITSPELSQIFGELISIWMINEWNALGSPQHVQVVELGPGRGTLVVDMLRTFNQLKNVLVDANISFHLVEMSPTLSKLQHDNLCTKSPTTSKSPINVDGSYLSGFSPCNLPLYWHSTLDTVPNDKCTLFIAHEFFDVLPVHKFIKDNDQWKEVFVDICNEGSCKLRFVIMPVQTPACKTLIKLNADEKRSNIEVSPQSAVIAQSIASRIVENSGAALIADYGHFGTKQDTLRAFKNHKLADVLSDVGNCDITADVDFKYLKESVQDFPMVPTGPITQHRFLKNMGIDTRLMMLLRNCENNEVRRKLIGSYDIMVNPQKMGDRFLFLSLTSRQRINTERGKFSPVTAFHEDSYQ